MIRQRNIHKDSYVAVERISTGLNTETATNVVASRVFYNVEKVEVLELGMVGIVTSNTMSLDLYSFLDSQSPVTSAKGTLEIDGSANGVLFTSGSGAAILSLFDAPIVIMPDADASGNNRVGIKLQIEAASSPSGVEVDYYALVRVYRTADL